MNMRYTYPIACTLIVLIVILTIFNFPDSLHIAEPKLVMKDRFLWDKTAMAMMRNVTTLVPHNVTIAVSDYKPDFEFATHLRAVQPWDLSSAKHVHDFVSNHTKYLVVLEHDWDSKIIWGPQGLQNLSKYYSEIGNFRSDFFTIHVLKDSTTGV